MLYLITYDVQNNRKRTRLAKRLLRLGIERVQKSVFIGDLSDRQREELLAWIGRLSHSGAGLDVLVVPLHRPVLADVQHFGQRPPDWAYLTGERKVLFV